LHEVRILHRRCCYDNPACTGVDPLSHLVDRADRTPDLYRRSSFPDDLFYDCGVVTVIKHGIEIDDMEPFRPLGRKITGRFDRINIVNHGDVYPTPNKIHTTSLLQLDIRIYDHDDPATLSSPHHQSF